ncbi:hypothetical protein ACSYDW_04625 [Paeniglutamicibacter sp. R2-26]|uniref:hypothetical protein n=1 Tax=Paeniglutamicibacter sp. R2-26 TaxID=3144417 RepID=UPI003EE655BC
MKGTSLASPKTTRAQRKAGAELREARRTAERLRRQRASYRKRHKPGIFERMLGVVHSWPVAVRGSLLAIFAVLGIVLFSVGSAVEEQQYEADKMLVQTVEAQDALWVESPWWKSGKSNTIYVEVAGQRVALDRNPPMFSDQHVGDIVRVVVDPQDESRVVAANFDDTSVPVEPIDHIFVFVWAVCVFLVLLAGAYLVVLFFLYPELRALVRKLRGSRIAKGRGEANSA